MESKETMILPGFLNLKTLCAAAVMDTAAAFDSVSTAECVRETVRTLITPAPASTSLTTSQHLPWTKVRPCRRKSYATYNIGCGYLWRDVPSKTIASAAEIVPMTLVNTFNKTVVFFRDNGIFDLLVLIK